MRRRSGGGSGGGAGYRFQSQVIAFVDAHIMSKHPLGWLDTLDVPVAVGAETGGPGDDVCVFLQGSPRKIEVQAKGGLSADRRFYETLDRFFTGLMCDSSLRLILAVDPRASKPIRQDLRHDLNRLRQGRTDGLRQFTEKVLAYLGSHGAPEPAMLARHLYVVVIGMEDDAPWSKRDAIDLLEHDLNEPEQAAAAWELLVADGLTLIKERGQRDAVSLIGLLNSKQIRVSATHDGAQIHAYTHWLKDVTATFHIPGLGVALSINDAWIHLQAAQSAAQVTGSQAQSLESKLASYHEWERLSYRETAYMALDIAELDRHAIIIGGPGSGKSTLCQRVAHQLAASGERVLWVRLPLVLRRMQSYGESIDEALVHEATSGFRSPDKAVHRLLNDPVCLLADGLDECDPQREFIAGELRRWATSRVESRIVVTSRPIGHDPALFPNWMHAELLPLASDHIKADVERIIAASITNQTDARKKAARFESELRRNNVASVAARSPLLLGFLVQLFLNGVALPHGRADLYDHVLELWRQAPSRIGLSQTSQLDAVIARRSLEIIGWLLHTATAEQGSRSRRSLVSQLAGHLSTGPGTPYLVAESRV